MTRKLETLFDLPSSESIVDHLNDNSNLSVEETRTIIATVDDNIDRIDAALAEVSDVDKSDFELDEIADMAKKSFNDLSDLGMNVDSRFAAEILGVAGTMLGHALSAKTAKMNKKLKMPVRFEISHQLPGHSIALRAIVRVWGGVKVPRIS